MQCYDNFGKVGFVKLNLEKRYPNSDKQIEGLDKAIADLDKAPSIKEKSGKSLEKHINHSFRDSTIFTKRLSPFSKPSISFSN